VNQDSALDIVARLVAAWNSRDLDGFISMLSEDVVWHDPAMPAPAVGREAVRAFARAVFRAFPDFTYTIIDPVCVAPNGTKCAVHWHATATHLGPLDPPGYAPTGRGIDQEGVDLLWFDGAKVVRIVTLFDIVSALEQVLSLDLRPSPGSRREALAVGLQRLRARWLRATGAARGPESAPPTEPDTGRQA
jgi:steroid delta-isomerase-like uncharacterized protein